MTLTQYISALNAARTSAKPLKFTDTLSVIDAHYNFTPTTFQNGPVENLAETNSGSCKVFSFAVLHGLTQTQTLHMFAEHYQNVLDNPEGDAHGNIRAFMESGFDGLSFAAHPLTAK